MVWFDDKGRMQLCEAGISGFLDKIETAFSTCSGYTAKKEKK